jgi:hypothetical protein
MLAAPTLAQVEVVHSLSILYISMVTGHAVRFCFGSIAVILIIKKFKPDSSMLKLTVANEGFVYILRQLNAEEMMRKRLCNTL